MNKILLSLGVAALLCGGSAIIAPDSNSASAAEQTQAAPAKAAKTTVYTLKDGSKVTVATFEDGTVLENDEARRFLLENGIDLSAAPVALPSNIPTGSAVSDRASAPVLMFSGDASVGVIYNGQGYSSSDNGPLGGKPVSR